MASKRTADGFKKASLAGGERQFKQTKLNFGSFASSSSSSHVQRARQETSPSQDAALKATPSSQTQAEGQGQRPNKVTQPDRKHISRSRLNFNKEATKENMPPPSPRPLQAAQQSSPEQAQETPTNQTQQQTQNPGQLIRITDIEGDLFSAPPNSVLIHACNAIGSWGGGIALAFKKSYPEAFKVYNAHCKRHSADPRKLVGTALLIPPPAALPSPATAAIPSGPVPTRSANGQGKGKNTGSTSPSSANEARKQHWIGCLFTSKAYGKGRDSPGDILRATAPALGHLMKLVSIERTKSKKSGVEDGPGEIRMCQINSGLFDVPWKDTKRVVAEMTGKDVWEQRDEGKKDEDGDGDGDGSSEILSGLGDFPVHIGAYWRRDL